MVESILINSKIGIGMILYVYFSITETATMVQRLKDRYPNQVTFWRMDHDSYNKTLSDEDISSRLSKMQKITSPDLEEVSNALYERKWQVIKRA